MHQRAGAAVGAQPRVHREHQAGAGVGGDEVDHALGHVRPEHVLVVVLVGKNEHQVGVGSEIELAHSQAPERDHQQLLARFVSGRGRRMHGQHLFERHAIAGGERGVGQIGSDLQCIEHRHAQADAGGLDAKHLAPEETPQRGDVVEVRSRFSVGVCLAGRQTAQLLHELRHANQLFGEIGAVLENVQREARHGTVRVEQRHPELRA